MKINKDESLKAASVVALIMLCGTVIYNAYVVNELNDTLDNMSIGQMNGKDSRKMSKPMDMMMKSLEGKSGAEFDMAFTKSMIVHHEGAVDMANAALKNTTNENVLDLARDIISSQTKEIDMMKGWLGTSTMMMDHEGMGGMMKKSY